jgi:hypothetical protein
MRAQIDRLDTLATLGNVRIGVVPWDAEPRLLPWCGFSLFDRSAVSIVTFAGETVSSDPIDVGVHSEAFRIFTEAALFGIDARDVLARVVGDLCNA